MGATMKTSGERIRRGLSLVAFVGVALGLGTRQSVAGASSRDVFTATTTSSSNGAVLIALGCGVLVLGGIGFVVFTWSRRKRVPSQGARVSREGRALLGGRAGSFGGGRSRAKAG